MRYGLTARRSPASYFDCGRSLTKRILPGRGSFCHPGGPHITRAGPDLVSVLGPERVSTSRRRRVRRCRPSVQRFGADIRRVFSEPRRGRARGADTVRDQAFQVVPALRVSVRRPCLAGEAGATGVGSAARPMGRRRQRRAAFGARPPRSVVDRAHRRPDDASASIRARPVPLHSGMGKSVALVEAVSGALGARLRRDG